MTAVRLQPILHRVPGKPARCLSQLPIPAQGRHPVRPTGQVAQVNGLCLLVHSLGRLLELPAPDLHNPEPDAFVQQPLYVTETRNRVTYVTPPLSRDLQVTGPARLTFYASIDQPDTKWRVDVREAGSDAIYPLGSGWLKASHRALDPARTTPWEIQHDHTKEVPVVPGEINEYVVQLRPMSHLFKAGTQIKLEISAIDIPTDIETYDVMWHICNSATTLHKIYRDADHQSRLSLPVIPRG